MSIQDRREARTAKADEYRNLLKDNPGKLNMQVASKLTLLESEIYEIDGQINREERAMAMAADDLARGNFSGNRRGGEGASPDQIRALAAFYKNGDTSGFGDFRNALTESGDGGILVPHELAEEIISVQQKYSPMRQICRVVMSKTNSSRYTQPVNVGGMETAWVGENSARPETDTPSIEGVTFNDSEVYTNLPVSQWQEEDSLVGSWLMTEIGKEFSRKEGAAFLLGTGATQPKGILTYPTALTTDDTRPFNTLQHCLSGAAAGITADALITLLHSLKGAYRQSATWVLNGLTLAAIRKLKDTEGRYLWEPGLNGKAETLLGKPILEADDMPDIAADALPVMIGDFMSGYMILDRVMTVLRDPYSSKPNILFYARKRVSGAVVDSNAIKVMKIGA